MGGAAAADVAVDDDGTADAGDAVAEVRNDGNAQRAAGDVTTWVTQSLHDALQKAALQ